MSGIIWPNIEDISVISGRPASAEDVAAGLAVFVLKSDDGTLVGHAIDMVLPQYAYHINTETKEPTPCIIVQAEEIDGQKFCGCVSVLNGSLLVGLIDEFELHGRSIPN
jgi:hypothetical protein